MSRKKNCSIIYLTQSYFSKNLPKDIRLQCTYFIIFSIKQKKELIELAKDHAIGMDNKEFMRFFNEGTKEPYSWVMIDKKTTEDAKKFRKKFNYSFLNNWALIE
jgi:hypothetical protein